MDEFEFLPFIDEQFGIVAKVRTQDAGATLYDREMVSFAKNRWDVALRTFEEALLHVKGDLEAKTNYQELCFLRTGCAKGRVQGDVAFYMVELAGRTFYAENQVFSRLTLSFLYALFTFGNGYWVGIGLLLSKVVTTGEREAT